MIIPILLAAAQFLVIHPNGAREIWDKLPSKEQLPPGAQVCTFEPKEGDPKDPYLYVRHHSGAAVYVAPPREVVELSANLFGFEKTLIEDTGFPTSSLALVSRLAKIYDSAKRQQLWKTESGALDADVQQKILDAAAANNLQLQ